MAKRTHFIVYILLTYVLLQFCWWTYLLLDLSTGHGEISGQGISDRKVMILGEGAVFLLILLSGGFYLLRSIKRELSAARLQKNFLLAVSHELRSPIATIKLYLQTLEKRDLTEKSKQEIIKDLLESTGRLSDLTENVMTALRIEERSIRLQPEKQNVAEITTTVIKELQRTAGEHRITLESPEEVHISVDGRAYRSILINLMENAIKYSHEESVVQVSLHAENGKVVLTVRDHGIGIEPAEQERIFDRFYRSGSEETRKSTGTGLGLYIVKALCQAMNAELELRSRLNDGSTFAAKFPA